MALMEDPRVTVELISDGTCIYTRRCTSSSNREAGSERIALITDAMAAAGMEDGSYHLGSLAVDVVGGVAKWPAPTPSRTRRHHGSGLSQRRGAEQRPARDEALAIAVRQTSVIPARAVGLDEAGLLVGSAADLVVLNDDLRVARVMKTGAWVDLS